MITITATTSMSVKPASRSALRVSAGVAPSLPAVGRPLWSPRCWPTRCTSWATTRVAPTAHRHGARRDRLMLQAP